jgi:hypothetical protein
VGIWNVYAIKTTNPMIIVPELAAEALGSFLAESLRRRFGSKSGALIELVQSAARLALDCIGNSDALYHNVEHTMLVTLVGYDIMSGRSLLSSTSAEDYAHFLIACLLHDIGLVRGMLTEDSREGYVINANGGKAKLPRGSSDAALMPYRVDRSKLFVMNRIVRSKLLDADRVANVIEFTRFPASTDLKDLGNEECTLMRAADFIGQLGDPRYLQKANALYCEFAETGVNEKFGYTSAADLIDLYPQFYFNSLSTHLHSAIRYLNVTSSGRRWIDSLYGNIFRAKWNAVGRNPA